MICIFLVFQMHSKHRSFSSNFKEKKLLCHRILILVSGVLHIALGYVI